MTQIQTAGKCKVIVEYKPLPRCYCVATSCRVRWLTVISLNFSSRFFITATRPEGRVPWAAFCFFHSLILSLWRYRVPSLTCVCRWLLFLYAIIYIYICRYTCFGWFACFLTASDFHTKCMQLLVGLIFCKLVAISNWCFTVLLRDCVWCMVFWSGPLRPEDSSRQASSPEARGQQQAGIPT